MTRVLMAGWLAVKPYKNENISAGRVSRQRHLLVGTKSETAWMFRVQSSANITHSVCLSNCASRKKPFSTRSPRSPFAINELVPVLRWYAREGRDLPWRRTHDAYRILVSEVMLQQTQVSRVLVFYKTWLKKFPTWHALSRASNADVIHAWAGLGYNRRGLMLRDIAKHIVTHDLPKTEQEWLKLKGIGPYTAAAVASFAQGQTTVPIDTNIRRVLGRVLLGKTFPTLDDDARIRRHVTRYALRDSHWQAVFDWHRRLQKIRLRHMSAPFTMPRRRNS